MPIISALLARRLQLATLAEIGGEGDDLRAELGLQPLQDDGGVEPARIGKHHLLDVFPLRHAGPRLSMIPKAASFRTDHATRLWSLLRHGQAPDFRALIFRKGGADKRRTGFGQVEHWRWTEREGRRALLAGRRPLDYRLRQIRSRSHAFHSRHDHYSSSSRSPR